MTHTWLKAHYLYISVGVQTVVDEHYTVSRTQAFSCDRLHDGLASLADSLGFSREQKDRSTDRFIAS